MKTYAVAPVTRRARWRGWCCGATPTLSTGTGARRGCTPTSATHRRPCLTGRMPEAVSSSSWRAWADQAAGGAMCAPFTLHRRDTPACSGSARGGVRAQDAHRAQDQRPWTDAALIGALVDAGQAGAGDRPVAYACCPPPGLPAQTEDRSIVGRLLMRRSYFRWAPAPTTRCLPDERADWMSRNTFRRIEIAWPVRDPARAPAG